MRRLLLESLILSGVGASLGVAFAAVGARSLAQLEAAHEAVLEAEKKLGGRFGKKAAEQAFGEAGIVREGDAATIVALGRMVDVATAAADALKKRLRFIWLRWTSNLNQILYTPREYSKPL